MGCLSSWDKQMWKRWWARPSLGGGFLCRTTSRGDLRSLGIALSVCSASAPGATKPSFAKQQLGAYLLVYHLGKADAVFFRLLGRKEAGTSSWAVTPRVSALRDVLHTMYPELRLFAKQEEKKNNIKNKKPPWKPKTNKILHFEKTSVNIQRWRFSSCIVWRWELRQGFK